MKILAKVIFGFFISLSFLSTVQARNVAINFSAQDKEYAIGDTISGVLTVDTEENPAIGVEMQLTWSDNVKLVKAEKTQENLGCDFTEIKKDDSLFYSCFGELSEEGSLIKGDVANIELEVIDKGEIQIDLEYSFGDEATKQAYLLNKDDKEIKEEEIDKFPFELRGGSLIALGAFAIIVVIAIFVLKLLVKKLSSKIGKKKATIVSMFVMITLVGSLSGIMYLLLKDDTKIDERSEANTSQGLGHEYMWTKTPEEVLANNISKSIAKEIAVDNVGNKYILGECSRRVDFDPGEGEDIIDCTNSFRDYLSKFLPDGSYEKTLVSDGADGNGYQTIYNNITVDGNRNFYLSGNIDSNSIPIDFNINEGEDYITFNGRYTFISKYNSDGSYAWTRFSSLIMQGDAYQVDTEADDNGNIYNLGYFTGTIAFNSENTPDTRTSSDGRYAMFLTKHDTNGNYQWAKVFTSNSEEEYDFSTWYQYFTNEESNMDIDIDKNGNVYLTGGFIGTNVQFDQSGGSDLKSSFTENGGEIYKDIFITKYNANGSYGWTKVIGGNRNDNGTSIVADDLGNIYVFGNIETEAVDFNKDGGGDIKNPNGKNDLFVTKLEDDGDYVWTKLIGGSEDEIAQVIEVDKKGNIYFGGYLGSDNVNFNKSGGVDIISAAPYTRIQFFTKYNKDGSYGWTKVVKNENNHLKDIALDTSDNLYIVGWFEGLDVNFNEGGDNPDLKSSDCSGLCERSFFSMYSLATLPCPTNLQFTCENGQGTFSWNQVDGASKYMLRINREPVDDWPNEAEGDIRKLVETNNDNVTLEKGKQYIWWSVQPVISGEEEPFSSCNQFLNEPFSCDPIECTQDDDCAGSGENSKYCETTTKSCVQCILDSHCADGYKCDNNSCKPISSTPPDFSQGCNIDTDCIYKPAQDCCNCANGGTEVAILKSKENEYNTYIDSLACENIECPAVYKCEYYENVAPICNESTNKCELKSCASFIDLDCNNSTNMVDYSLFVTDYLAFRRRAELNRRSDLAKSNPSKVDMADYSKFVIEYLRIRRAK